ncbi:MAG: hypothetical protein EOP52_14225 [Sphingobacteriales bacterium]|nr:MAG: hypothetical protein EOP52_14225 [Sphingobacteriales bacterium]
MNYEGLRHVTNDDLTDEQRIAAEQRNQEIQALMIQDIENYLKGELDRNVGAQAISQVREQDAYAYGRMKHDAAPAHPSALQAFEREGGETTGGIDA